MAIMLEVGEESKAIEIKTAGFGTHVGLYFYHQGDILARLGSYNAAELVNALTTAIQKISQPTVADNEAQHADSGRTWTRAAARPTKPANEMTHADVIAWFQASPILRTYAPELKKEWLKAGHITQDQVASAQLDSDLEKCVHLAHVLFDNQGEPVRGAQAQIAQALGVSNAGSYRVRILEVLEILQDEAMTAINAAAPVIEPEIIEMAA